MEDVGVVARDGLGACFALKRRNLVPEMIEHRVGRGMAVVPAPVHFTPGDDIDAGDLLLKDRGLGRAQLGISEVTLCELAQSNKPVQGLVPARHAVRAHYGGGVRCVVRHRGLSSLPAIRVVCGPSRMAYITQPPCPGTPAGKYECGTVPEGSCSMGIPRRDRSRRCAGARLGTRRRQI